MKKMKYEDGGEIPVEAERTSRTEEVLGTLSPIYGMMKGVGAFGKNDLGLMPAIARRMRRNQIEKGPVSVSIEIEDEGMEEENGMLGGGMTYAKGGMTKKGGRDGCAIRGKTKGRMV